MRQKKEASKIIEVNPNKLKKYLAQLKRQRHISTRRLNKNTWLQLRHIIGIGGSDVAPALGLSKYITPNDLYLSKIATQIISEENNLTRWGNILESEVLKEFARTYNLNAVPDYKLRLHPHYDFLFANLDGVVLDKNNNIKATVEIKTTAKYNYDNWTKNPEDNPQGIPIYMYCQIQHGLSCLPNNVKQCYLVIFLVDMRDIVVKEIIRDDNYIKIQTQALVEFYENHIKQNIPPPLKAIELDYKKQIEGSQIEATSEIADIFLQLQQKTQMINELKSEAEDLKNKIKEYIGINENLTLLDKVIATYKTHERKMLDTQRLKSELPDIFSKYNKVITIRNLRLRDID